LLKQARTVPRAHPIPSTVPAASHRRRSPCWSTPLARYPSFRQWHLKSQVPGEFSGGIRCPQAVKNRRGRPKQEARFVPKADNSSSVLGRGDSMKKRLTISSTAELPQRFRIS
jgi:hypothetical protein